MAVGKKIKMQPWLTLVGRVSDGSAGADGADGSKSDGWEAVHPVPLSHRTYAHSTDSTHRTYSTCAYSTCAYSTYSTYPTAGVLPASLTIVRRVFVLPTADPLEWDAWETWELLGDQVVR